MDTSGTENDLFNYCLMSIEPKQNNMTANDYVFIGKRIIEIIAKIEEIKQR